MILAQETTATAITAVTAGALAVATLIVAQNFIRYLKAGIAGDRAGWNGVLGILLAVAFGIGVVALFAWAGVTGGIEFVQGRGPLESYDFGSQVVLGIALGAGGSFGVDWLASRDNSDTANKPRLLGGSGPTVE